MKHTY